MCKWFIGKSKIHGYGIGVNKDILVGELIDIGIYTKFFVPVVSHFGSYINHSFKPTTDLVKIGNIYYVRAIKNINKFEEITLNYDMCPWFIRGSKSYWK